MCACTRCLPESVIVTIPVFQMRTLSPERGRHCPKVTRQRQDEPKPLPQQDGERRLRAPPAGKGEGGRGPREHPRRRPKLPAGASPQLQLGPVAVRSVHDRSRSKNTWGRYSLEEGGRKRALALVPQLPPPCGQHLTFLERRPSSPFASGASTRHKSRFTAVIEGSRESSPSKAQLIFPSGLCAG